ncbi:hypothetical protein BRADI_5g01366v3 [Brachypodium distachyon]|nr:hypothetical protein BRADI_5g01366v3 [Brachypodium distachyon]PNT60542.1 hypothetical protein BRADI_5g01366v3 [Brachypodium distachyon]
MKEAARRSARARAPPPCSMAGPRSAVFGQIRPWAARSRRRSLGLGGGRKGVLVWPRAAARSWSAPAFHGRVRGRAELVGHRRCSLKAGSGGCSAAGSLPSAQAPYFTSCAPTPPPPTSPSPCCSASRRLPELRPDLLPPSPDPCRAGEGSRTRVPHPSSVPTAVPPRVRLDSHKLGARDGPLPQICCFAAWQTLLRRRRPPAPDPYR